MIRHDDCEYIAPILHRHVHRSWSSVVGMAGDVGNRLVDTQLHIIGSTLRKAMLHCDTFNEFSRRAEDAGTRFCCEAQRHRHRRLRRLYPASQRPKQLIESDKPRRLSHAVRASFKRTSGRLQRPSAEPLPRKQHPRSVGTAHVVVVGVELVLQRNHEVALRGRERVLPAWLVGHESSRLELPLLDPQLLRNLGIVTAHLLDEPLGVLAPDEDLERVPEWEVVREGVIDDA